MTGGHSVVELQNQMWKYQLIVLRNYMGNTN